MKNFADIRLVGFAAALAVFAASFGIAPFAAAALAGDGPSKLERKRHERADIQTAMERGELLPLPKAIALAQTRVAGDVLKIELEKEEWGIKYEVKILTATGRVREVELNARTGALIKIEDD